MPVEYRRLRFSWLAQRPEVVVIESTPFGGFRLIHYEWPQSQAIEFYPDTSVFERSDGTRDKGWNRLLKELTIPTSEWRDYRSEIAENAAGVDSI